MFAFITNFLSKLNPWRTKTLQGFLQSKYADTDDHVLLLRGTKSTTQTLGKLFYKGKQVAVTLELPFRDNRKGISCVPKGEYKVVRRMSNKYGQHFHLLDVPNRELILIHAGNNFRHTRGCIIVGKSRADLNNDKHLDVNKSQDTLKNLLAILPKKFKLVVADA